MVALVSDLAPLLAVLLGGGGLAWAAWAALQRTIERATAQRRAEDDERRMQAARAVLERADAELAELRARNTRTEAAIVRGAELELGRATTAADVAELVRESKGEP